MTSHDNGPGRRGRVEAVGLRTVAEGIESPAQAEALRVLGSHTGPGYTWSRPLPLIQLAVLLREPGRLGSAMFR